MKYRIEFNKDDFATVELKSDKIFVTYREETVSFLKNDIDRADIDSLCMDGKWNYAYIKNEPVKFEISKLSHMTKVAENSKSKADGKIRSPVSGKLVLVHKKIGDSVKVGDLLIELEAMKIIYKVHSDLDGVIKSIVDISQDFVSESDLIVDISGIKK